MEWEHIKMRLVTLHSSAQGFLFDGIGSFFKVCVDEEVLHTGLSKLAFER